MPIKQKFHLLFFLCLGFIFLGNTETFGQISSSDHLAARKKIIQLSGIVLGEDSLSALPGVHIYVPKAGRGTTSNHLGYFTMPTLVGDSVVFSMVGFQRHSFIVPDHNKDLTVIVELTSDTTYLETIDVLPFPTEEMFKEAVLALNLPLDGHDYSNQNMSAEVLAFMLSNTPVDANVNYRNQMNNLYQAHQDRFGPRPNPFLNPFNWAGFFQSLKRGDYKK